MRLEPLQGGSCEDSLAQPPIGCLTSGQLLNVSGPQCVHLSTEVPGQHDLWWLLARSVFSGSELRWHDGGVEAKC